MRTLTILVLFWCLAGLAASGAQAAPGTDMYLTDTIKITMRSGKGMDHKIIALLQVGQKVSALAVEDEWTQIRTEAGKEGWVLSRFVSAEVPNRILLQQLQSDYASVTERCDALEKENKALINKNQALEAELASNIETSQARIEELAEENEGLKGAVKNRYLKWFLAGAGVLLVGYLIGYRAKREKRRLYL
ncbi:MAG: TIGR04211 family SH3 domain-containing protein [Thermodesulfobacteriota bacterium]|nr:TIGR04211 family SH3 domain-containing protein [Thermodesulfobacteriota bacterium]